MAPKPALVLLPVWGTGHLMSMLDAGKKMLSHLNDNNNSPFSITVLLMQPPTSESSSEIESRIQQVISSGLDIQFHNLPLISPPTDTVGVEEFVSRYIQLYVPHVKAALTDISNSVPVSALVIDFFATTMLDVSRELNVPAYVYYTSTAAMVALQLRLPALHDEVTSEFDEMEGDVHVPGMPPIPPVCMPSPVTSKKNPNYTWFVYHGNRFMESDSIIINTATELEPRVLKAITNGECVPGRETPPIYPIGPVVSLNNAHTEKHQCLEWLDEQPPASVVFLCFGSMGCFEVPQVKEMAIALERSGQRFLWTLRGLPDKDSTHPVDAKPEMILPDGFLENTKDRGLVWPSWAPQKDILEHAAIGAFVTHCGWNSTLESIWFGVPMIPWPLYAEQHFNAFEMVREMGVAVEMMVDRKNGNFVEAAELEKAVRRLMGDSEEGRRVKEKVKEMKAASRKALEKGGSSYDSLQKLAQRIRSGVKNNLGFNLQV